MNIGERIKAVRLANGISQKDLAEKIGKSPSTVSSWENDGVSPRREILKEVAEALNVDVSVLEFGKHSEDIANEKLPKMSVPIVGYVGAGGTITPIDDHAMGYGIDEVEVPPTTATGTVAVIVRGDSMYPMLQDKMVVYYSMREKNISDYIHQIVIAHFEDGRKAIKTLTMGTEKGTFTLISFNAPPITNVRLESVSPMDWIKPL